VRPRLRTGWPGVGGAVPRTGPTSRMPGAPSWLREPSSSTVAASTANGGLAMRRLDRAMAPMASAGHWPSFSSGCTAAPGSAAWRSGSSTWALLIGMSRPVAVSRTKPPRVPLCAATPTEPSGPTVPVSLQGPPEMPPSRGS
jgi:hypothetical protein